MMKILLLCVVAAGLFCGGCDQDPIFFTVSHGVAPKQAKITGAPSKIESDGSSLYVANGKVWKAEKPDFVWNELPSPSGGGVRDIAYAGALHALTVDNASGATAVWKFNSGSWEKLIEGGKNEYQSIWNKGGLLVCRLARVPTQEGRDFQWGTVSGGKFTVTKNDTYAISAVSGSTGATYGGGIDGTRPGLFLLGVAVFKGFTISVGREALYLNGAEKKFDKSYEYTGALAVWKDSLCLIGVRSDSTHFGYMEWDGSSNTLWAPGSKPYPTTMSDNTTFATTIGTRALTAIMQAPGISDEYPLMFASTQSDGLWSFRHDGKEGRKVWNREE